MEWHPASILGRMQRGISDFAMPIPWRTSRKGWTGWEDIWKDISERGSYFDATLHPHSEEGGFTGCGVTFRCKKSRGLDVCLLHHVICRYGHYIKPNNFFSLLFTPLESPAACSGDEDIIPFRANTGFNAPCEPPRWKVEDFLTGFT